jgi:hypothetical protein
VADEICVDVERGAELLGISPTTLRSYVDQGLIPTISLPSATHAGRSRRVLLLVKDLQEFAERHRTEVRLPDAKLSTAAIRTWRQKREGAA